MTLAADLASLLGSDKVRSGESVALLDSGLDQRNLAAGLVVFPSSVSDIQSVLAFAHARGVAVVPHGGRSGLAGGAVSQPGDIILSMQRMDRILHIDAATGVAIVEAGVVLEKLDAALLPHNLSLGVDLGARGSATIGGMISTNAGGIEAFRNGSMRARVLGLEAVLADGTVMSDLSQVTKCNEGYDIKQLFIGAEGTLGVVTRAVVRLAQRPLQRATALVTTETTADAIALFRSLQRQGLLAFELMNGDYFRLAVKDAGMAQLAPMAETCGFAFVVEIERPEDDLVEALSEASISDAILAKSDAEREAFWRLREDSWVVDRHFPQGLWYDISVPLSAIDSYLQKLGGRLAVLQCKAGLYTVGHMGDGNLHLTIVGPAPLNDFAKKVSEAVYDGLHAMGGSISAEHGIGLEKRESLARLANKGKLAMMNLIKQAFDPRGIMNPGKVVQPSARQHAHQQ